MDIEVRPSPIAGRGVFAMRDFAPGDRIREIAIVREITDAAPLRAGENAEHCMYEAGRSYLVAPPDCYVNHCCEPNAYHWREDGKRDVRAMRAIRSGEEITYDYMLNTHGGSTWPCACGAPCCRGATARSFFDLPRDLQRRYLPYLERWFVEAHPTRIRALQV